jgi:hypothetical protein
MDILKHMGKENQIQNYRLAEKIEEIKEHLVFYETQNKGSLLLNSPRSCVKMDKEQNIGDLN